MIFLIGISHASCKINKPAQRIISLAPDITETLFAIGAGNQIVGEIQGSDFPEAAKKIPLVGSYSGIDNEKLLSLHPDLIVVWGQSFSRQLQILKKSGIPVYQTNPQDLADIPREIQDLGCLTGHEKSAEKQAKLFITRLDKLAQKYQQRSVRKVFFQIGSYSLITINKHSWINQVINLCGGKNIFADAYLAAPQVSLEYVIGANPDVIISDADNPEWKNHWLKWTSINAVKHQNLYSINADIIERASPRVLDGAEKICDLIDGTRITA